jgi:DNA-binding NtrC family response regulator
LLRAIERGEIQRLRGQAPVRVDVRLVAAASSDIKSLVEQGKFRDDLYYRLAEIRLDLPLLKDRPEDIPALVSHFFAKYADQIVATGSTAKRLAPGALQALQRFTFPGNVRELVNVLRRGVAAATGEEVLASDLPVEVTGAKPGRGGATPSVLLLDSTVPFKDAKAQVLDAFERQYLIDLLHRHKMHISRAAREAGIDRRHLYRLLDKYGIEFKEREIEERD